MTPRQQRRLEQKLARKAQKHDQRHNAQLFPEPAVAQAAQVAQTLVCEEQAGSPAISEPKLLANRINSQHSTGPTSEAGKATVSQNATKHGLTGKFKVLACESQSEFDQLLASFIYSEVPIGDNEIEMVHQMTEAFWLSRRCVRLQNDCFGTLESEVPEEQRAAQKSLALYMRYQTMHDRTFARYATELRKRRNERARVERGFVSQKHKEVAERRREEIHEARQSLQNVKLETQKIRNRLTAAKTEALELKNLAKKSNTLAAAA